jgi:hypothetical protein
MSQSEHSEFAHGTYGDDSGVVFYGPPAKGFWTDRLVISDRYIEPLFCAIWMRPSASQKSPAPPKLISEWNSCEGWTDALGIVEISRHDAEDLIAALVALTPAELEAHLHSPPVHESLRCANAIRSFLQSHLDRGLAVYIEDD